MKTLIAIPSMDLVPARFAQSLAMLRKDGECEIAFQIGSLVYNARNSLANIAIQTEADRVLWLDSDMVFAPDILSILGETMKETDADIVTGLYFRRVPPYTPVLYDKLEQVSELSAEYRELKDLPKERIFEVAGCGFGCVLMGTDVFLSLDSKFGQLFNPTPGMGEDLAFCWRARQCGYKIICDQSVQLGHVGYEVYTKGFYNAYRQRK